VQKPKFKIFKKDKQYSFRLLRGNGDMLLSGESYTQKATCERAIALVKENAPNEDRYEDKTASNGKYYFELKAGNEVKIGKSDLYTWLGAMEHCINSIMRNAPNATVEDATYE